GRPGWLRPSRPVHRAAGWPRAGEPGRGCGPFASGTSPSACPARAGCSKHLRDASISSMAASIAAVGVQTSTPPSLGLLLPAGEWEGAPFHQATMLVWPDKAHGKGYGESCTFEVCLLV